MKIREATEQDIPEILEVLKASLGEISSKKSEDVWRYKHIDNPFGRSLVLLATEEEKIIGVRAFMRWNWQKCDQVFSAFRAVDTATLPDHQGKGIFKKLTLKAIEIAEENGDHFIFNTPNAQSLPGYLKMGWEKVGKINVQVIPANPFYRSKPKEETGNLISGFSNPELNNLLDKANQLKKGRGKIFTPKSIAYLNWRYESNPLQVYEIINETDSYALYYIKKHNRLLEMRIVEFSALNNSISSHLKKRIHKRARVEKVHIITYAGDRKLFRFAISGDFGPILTLRNLNYEQKLFSDLLNMSNWNYSLGDLELF